MCAAARKRRCARSSRRRLPVRQLRRRRRLPGAGRDRARDRPAAGRDLADPRDRRVRQISGNVYKKPFAITGAGHRLGRRDRRRAETTSPTLAELSFPAMELYAMPAATQTLLDDSAVNIDEWIAAEVEPAFAEPGRRGLRHRRRHQQADRVHDHTKVAEASWAWASSATSSTGPRRRLRRADPSDKLIDLVYALKAGYRQNARWVMNRRRRPRSASSRTPTATTSGSRRRSPAARRR